jgi:hypothetical protein
MLFDHDRIVRDKVEADLGEEHGLTQRKPVSALDLDLLASRLAQKFGNIERRGKPSDAEIVIAAHAIIIELYGQLSPAAIAERTIETFLRISMGMREPSGSGARANWQQEAGVTPQHDPLIAALIFSPDAYGPRRNRPAPQTPHGIMDYGQLSAAAPAQHLHPVTLSYSATRRTDPSFGRAQTNQ